MFVVWVGSVLTTVLWVAAARGLAPWMSRQASSLPWPLWLWFTLLFANFAEAMAEGRGKAQADALRRTRTETMAKKLADAADRERRSTRSRAGAPQGRLRAGRGGRRDSVDGEVVEGSRRSTRAPSPVRAPPSSARAAATELGDGRHPRALRLARRAHHADPGETFLDRMIAMVEGAARKKTPNEIALDILLAALTIVFLLACVTLVPFSIFSIQAAGRGEPITLTVLVALLVCLIPTTIGALLSAIGIAGMDRMIQANVIAMSGRAVEAAGDVDVLLLDKTGTITLGQPTGPRVPPGARRDRGGSPTRRSSPPWPMRRPRAAASWCWRKEFDMRGRNVHELKCAPSFPSRRRPG